MGMANVYQPPIKPKVGFYLEHLHAGLLRKIRHISRKTGIITAVYGKNVVLKVHRKHLDENFIVRDDIYQHG